MRNHRMLAAAIGAVSFLAPSFSSAADWPQYRGSSGDGICTEKLDLAWPATGPKVLWKTPTLNGFSSFSIAAGKCFTQVNRDVDGAKREVLLALDATTGKELWFADIGVGKYDGGGDDGAGNNKGGDGPRSTPAFSDGLVYTLNQFMVLNAFDAQSGKPAWTHDLMKEYAGRKIGWQSAASPVVDGDLVYAAAGGPGQALLAFNKKTGELAWKGQDEAITHASPVVATILGQRQVIFFCQRGLVSVAASDGKVLWKFPFPYSVSTAASPVVCGEIVYCSAGYNVGGGACKIAKAGDAFTATQLWKIAGNAKVANHWSTPVYKDGHLYGMFGFKNYGTGPMKCVEAATGAIKWEQPGFGAGNVILVGDKVLALSDTGEVVVAQASPDGYKESARFKAIEGKCWSTPALSDGRVYVRSTKEGACLELGK